MKFMVCLAGLPTEVVEEIHKRSVAIFTGDRSNSPIVKPISPPFSYREGMSDHYLSELARRLEKLSPKEDAAILLVYTAYNGEATQEFIKNFFPFAITAPLSPFYPTAAPKHERRSNLVNHIDHIIEVVSDLRSRANVVRDIYSGQNFTPLLLPLRNFQSDVLMSKIEVLFSCLGSVRDPRAKLKEACEAIGERHPLQQTNGHRPYFEDDRNLRFKSPGKDRHGMARQVGGGHQSACLIGSRVRLGGPFDALFHYDCEYERRSVDNEYPNCHDEATQPAAKSHVNIAPSDAIR
jgi:hypothetical protein